MTFEQEQSRPRVLILFGGRSGEHSISCATAAGFMRAIDRNRWDVLPVGITRDGVWVRVPDQPELFEFRDGHGQHVTADRSRIIMDQASSTLFELTYTDSTANTLESVTSLGTVDLVLPLLHGPYGEDGTLQGLFDLAGQKYVGCGVMSSAASMDKHVTKTLLHHAGIKVGRWELVTQAQWDADAAACQARIASLGFPVFVKPCRAGSSLGISRVDSMEELSMAMKEAQNHDPRVIVEAAFPGREIECGVLQMADGSVQTAPLGEIVIPEGGFYDYESKYFDTEAIGLECPAQIEPAVEAEIRQTAAKAFEVLACEGLARVDFFYDPHTGEIAINEVNTMPGFTPYSMFPQMWARAGMSYPELITHLLDVALTKSQGLR